MALDKTDYQTLIATLLADNVTQEISEEDLRDLFNETADIMFPNASINGIILYEWLINTIFQTGLVIVFRDDRFYKLTEPVRPFETVDFAAELLAGQWLDLFPTTPIQLSGSTTDENEKELFINGIASQRLVLPTDTNTSFDILITGKQTGGASGTVGDLISVKLLGSAKNIGDDITLTGFTTMTLAGDEAAETWEIFVEADDANNALALKVVGEINKNIDWLAMAEIITV